MVFKKFDNKILSIIYIIIIFFIVYRVLRYIIFLNIWEIKSFDRLKFDIYFES